jgi:hypothetical protein
VAQTLVNVVTVTNLAGGATFTVAHGLESNGASVIHGEIRGMGLAG